MRAEILSVGTELLVGSILNTNARFLAQKLAENGVDLYHQATVGDNTARIIDCLEAAAARADLIITTGGLGPTEDDVTARAVAGFLGKTPKLHQPTLQHIQKRLAKRGMPMTKLVQQQCYLPENLCRFFINQNGTASGFLDFREQGGKKTWVLVLPGPPRELEPMFISQALPTFFKVSGFKPEHFQMRAVRIHGYEHEVAGKVSGLLKMKPPVTVGIYAKPGEVELKIMSKAPSRQKALSDLNRLEKTIRQKLGKAVIGIDDESLNHVVAKLLLKKKKTLSLAESCTGGLLGARITELAGSSRYFLGGVQAYANKVKELDLVVSKEDLKKYGAVSEVVAKQMAAGVRKKIGADYGLSITGIAGPDGGTKTKPVGLVYIGLADKNKSSATKFIFSGNRQNIRNRAVQEALNLLRLRLLS